MASTKAAQPTAYTATRAPILGAGVNAQPLLDELASIQAALSSTQFVLPQPATAPPQFPIDGLQRLARAPWRPLGGTADVWVYWDAGTAAWRAL